MREKVKNACTPAPIDLIMYPFKKFMQLESASGLSLIGCAIAAMIWANSPWADTYEAFWHIPVTMGFGAFSLQKPLLLWINDGLMAIFFFLVGLEIKREVLIGELSTLRKALLPITAAIGGMIVPALFYSFFNLGTLGQRGWAIPTATDIAFALGILSLLGNRVPLALKVFLAALAVADDLGAIMIIGLFYTDQIFWSSLLVGAGFFGALVVANRLGTRSNIIYFLLSFGLWLGFLKSGIHATIAGVLAAMTIPATTRLDTHLFVTTGRDILEDFECAAKEGKAVLADATMQSAIHALKVSCEYAETPLQKIEHSLHPWVAFGVMPIFALANSGIAFHENFAQAFLNPITWGIIAGLVLGKPIGIFLFSWGAIKLGITCKSEEMTWLHLFGAACLGGIGFTMSLFIANLAFGINDLLDMAKVGILLSSLIASIIGYFLLHKVLRHE